MSSSVTVAPEDTRTGDTLCVCFNADASVLAVGTVGCLYIYSADPFVLLREHSVVGGIRNIALFGQSNVFAAVPGAKRNRVWLWDDTLVDPRACTEITDAEEISLGLPHHRPPPFTSASPVPDGAAAADDEDGGPPGRRSTQPEGTSPPGESTTPHNVVAQVDLDSDVAAVRLHARCVVVASCFNVYLFDSALRRVATFEVDPMACRALALQAFDTPNGEVNIALPSPAVGNLVLCKYFDRPPPPTNINAADAAALAAVGVGGGGRAGQVLFKPQDYQRQLAAQQQRAEAYKIVTCAPHHSTIGCVAMTHDGAYVVSASVQGTALKLVETRTGNTLRQLNRGATTNRVHSIAFNSGGTLVVCASETGTVHMFSTGCVTKLHGEKVTVTNPRSLLTGVARTVGDNGSFAAATSSRVRQAVDFAQGDFAFATFSIPECDPSDTRRVFKGTLVALKQGIARGRASMLIAQSDWGRAFKVAVDVTAGGEASAMDSSSTGGAKSSGRGSRCMLLWSARFPEQDL